MTTPGGPPPSGWSQPGQYQNIASGQAYVDTQIGQQLFGSVGTVVQGNNLIYTHDESGESRYRAGVRLLAGGAPRAAEGRIEKAADSGQCPTEVAYYWTLALVSGRRLDELDRTTWAKMQSAAKLTLDAEPDGWTAALTVVHEFLQCTQVDGGPDALPQVLENYQQLPVERADEVWQHVRTILHGELETRFEALRAEWVREQRTAGGREQRVPKFFEPDPAPPRRRPVRPPDPGIVSWVALVGGAILAGLGLLLVLSLVAEAALAGAVLVFVLGTVGGYLTSRCGMHKLWLARCRLVKEQELTGTPPWPQPDHRGHDGYTKVLRQLVDLRYATVPGLRGSAEAEQFLTATAGHRAVAASDLSRRYANAGHESVPVNQLDWLIRHTAGHALQDWRSGEMYRYQKELQDPTITAVGWAAGVLALLVAGLVAVVDGLPVNALGMIGAAALIGVGGWLGGAGGIEVFLERRRSAAELADAQERLAAEHRAYQEWLAYLADRPSDAEMARWLALDLAYLRSAAMEHHGLTGRDLLEDLVLVEPAEGCLRGRVPHGPTRYSAYRVQIFLLTTAGVRRTSVLIDFAKATEHNEQRTTFRYEMISAAAVTEVGIRMHGDRRQVVSLDDQPLATAGPDGLITSRALKLSLVGAAPINVLLENYDDLKAATAQEDPEYLYQLALDTSGVGGAMRVLEAVAGEGRDWIAHEQERRRRRTDGDPPNLADWIPHLWTPPTDGQRA